MSSEPSTAGTTASTSVPPSPDTSARLSNIRTNPSGEPFALATAEEDAELRLNGASAAFRAKLVKSSPFSQSSSRCVRLTNGTNDEHRTNGRTHPRAARDGPKGWEDP